MSKKADNGRDDRDGFVGALRYIAYHSPASLFISVIVMIAIYILDRNSEFLAAIATLN